MGRLKIPEEPKLKKIDGPKLVKFKMDKIGIPDEPKIKKLG